MKKLATTIQKLGLALVSSTFLLQGFIAPQISQAQNATNAKAENFYKQAEQDLPENYYVVYRIVDRIARANNLDKTPWRIIVTSSGVVNAYATEYNLMVFESGILQQLEGNPSALACVIAHEMGHHVKQHLGYGPLEQEKARLEEIKRLEREQLIAEQDAQTQALLGGAAASGIQQGAARVGGFGGQVLNVFGGIVGNASQQKGRNIEQIKAEIAKEAELRYQKRLVEINHNQEYESDELGYMYSVKAGFKPDGCLTTMDIIGRSHGSQLASDSHPAPEQRAQKIQALMQKYPSASLYTQEVKQMLNSENPLTYKGFDSQTSNGGKISGLQIQGKGGDTKGALEEMF